MKNPSFDTWTTIFLFAAVQGLFVSAVLLFVRKENRQARVLLACLSLLFSITLIEYVMWWTGYMIYVPHLLNISAAFPFLFGPIIYYYFKCVFEDYRFKPVDLIVVLPFLLNVIDLSSFYFASAETKLLWLAGKGPPTKIFMYWPWIRIIHMLLYALFAFFNFNAMSRVQQEVRTWFRMLNIFYALFILSYASYFILVLLPGFKTEWDYMISFAMMFTIYFLAWFGYLQPRVFSGFTITEAINLQSKYRHSSLTADTGTELAEKLAKLMQEDKYYRESELSLETLAEKVGTTKHNLSQVINEKMGMNFFEYINSLRIAEAQLLLTNKSRVELNIIEVAYKVGFNNKVSFNNMFKKITGMTPTAYRKQHSVAVDFSQN